MRILATLFIFIFVTVSHLAGAAPRIIIRCKGEVWQNGVIDPTHEVVLSSSAGGLWYLHVNKQLIYGGASISRDPNRIFVDNYHAFRDAGVRIHYDYTTHRLTLKYKFYLGSLGGGNKRTSGIFENCEEFENELPKPTVPACANLLR